MMRAVRFHRFGGPEVLQVERVPKPTVTPGHALVDVVAAGVNFADTERRRGLYLAGEPLPAITGPLRTRCSGWAVARRMG